MLLMLVVAAEGLFGTLAATIANASEN